MKKYKKTKQKKPEYLLLSGAVETSFPVGVLQILLFQHVLTLLGYHAVLCSALIYITKKCLLLPGYHSHLLRQR